MATTKQRINISVPKEMETFLRALAKRDEVPVATKAKQLIQAALALEEDLILEEMAATRDTKDAVFVSHKEVWG